jgi:uncharacterized protein (DUF1015 family)
MVQVLPFRGLRYAPDRSSVTAFAPPYDVIDAAQRQQFLASAPHNIVHIDLGPGQDPAWYAEAVRIRDRWLAEGVLKRDPTPAFYCYQQHFVFDGVPCVRTGLLGAVRLAEWGQGIHRHERTRVGPRQDRLNLMRALRAQTSPVFGLYSDPADELGRWLTPPAQPAVDVTDPEGVRHLFWLCTDRTTLQALTTALAKRDVVIADGHHRYETALAYRAERRAADGDPSGMRSYDYVLMYLTAAESAGLQILATHRVVRAPVQSIALLQALQADFVITPQPEQTSLMDAIAQARPDEVVFGLCLEEGSYVLRLRSLERALRAAGDQPAELASLDVNVLQNLILAPRLGISAKALATGEQVSYTIHEEQACALVRCGKAQAAFILNPTRVEQVWRAALKGHTMPQKSTYFWPKLLTGLVIHPLDESLPEGAV